MRTLTITLILAAWLPGCAGPRLASPLPVSGSGSDDGQPLAREVQDAVADPAAQDLDTDIDGYGTQGRRVVGSPGDINVDLATSFPRRRSLTRQIIPQAFFDWKKRLHKRPKVMLAASYQALVQRHSNLTALAPAVTDSRTFAGGHALLEARWSPLCPGGEYEGSLEVALDWRHSLFGYETPFVGSVVSGSGWSTGAIFWEWDPSVTALFWQQWFGKQVLEVRVGKQATPAVFDFFRFKDARVSSMADPLHADIASVPAPPPGYGLSFKAWPFKRSSLRSLYVSGVVADMNGDPTELNPESVLKGQFFYGLEIGYNWKRNFPKDFDHLHLDLWYADHRTDPYDFPSVIPNKPGWGCKLAGSKQWGRVVAYAKFTHNEAHGGGLGLTWANNSASLGAVLLTPACLNGELGLGLSWMDPLKDVYPGPFQNPRDQYGADLYWKMLITPNLWVTPGVQFIVDPSLSLNEDTLTVLGLKVRWFF